MHSVAEDSWFVRDKANLFVIEKSQLIAFE